MLVTLFTAGLVTSGVVAGAGPLAVLSDSTTTETTAESGTTSPESTTESTTTDEETTSEENTTESTTTEPTTTESTPPPSGPPTISSDRNDYAPGSHVTLTGTNWEPGETVNIDVNDDAGQTWRRTVGVVANDRGEIVDQFNLPDWFVATYRVVATGSSGSATTSFTDGNMQFLTNGPTLTGIAWQRHNDTTCTSPLSGTANSGTGTLTSSTATSLQLGDNNNQSLSLTAPAVAGSQNFVNWTGDGVAVFTTSGTGNRMICAVGFGGSGVRAVTANYAATDTTPPVITPSVSGTLGSNGWYTSNVSVSWTVADPDSAITSQSGCGTSNVAADTAGATFTCTATSSGGTTSQSVTIKRDATAPTIANAGVQSGTAGSNGWYVSAVTNRFTATDAGSGLNAACQAAFPSGNRDVSTGSSEGTNVTVVSGPCSDLAGNTNSGVSSALFKIDLTTPVITDLGPTTSPNGNGWYKTDVINQFRVSDALSGLNAACEAAFPDPVSGGRHQDRTTSGEGAAVTVDSSSCTDLAGNTASARTSAAFKVDKTDPGISFVGQSPAKNANGWNNTDVTLSWTCTDGGSGVVDGTVSKTITSEGTAQQETGTCADLAGNTSSSTNGNVNIDKTDPGISFVGQSPAKNANGWNNTDVTLSWTCTDGGSGVVDGTVSKTITSEGTAQQETGTCADLAGNTSSSTNGNVNIDKTDPGISFVGQSPAKNANGWNNTDVTLSWTCTDGGSGVVDGTVSKTITSEGTAQQETGTCADLAGNTSSSTNGNVNIDKTDPGISFVGQSPAKNANGWNNTDVTLSWTCTDGGSGVVDGTVSKTITSEGTAQQETGTCADLAGNTSSSTNGNVNIDKTDPGISFVGQSPAKNANGWNNTDVTLSWTCTDGGSGVVDGTVSKTITSEGTAQQETGTCADLAGNTSSSTNGNVNIDKTDPGISFVGQSPAKNANGWNNTDVTLSWTCTDGGSGVVDGTVSKTITSEGTAQQETGTCADLAGNTSSSTNGNVNIDKTDPGISFVGQSPAKNANGWNNTDVTLSWTCTDGGSGVVDGTVSKTITSEGTAQQETGTCADLAGNTSSSTNGNVNIDKTDPGISFVGQSPAKNANGWNNTDVTLSWTCTDGGSGVVDGTVSKTITSEGTAQQETGTCADLAGNTSSSTNGNVNIDKTKPVVAVTGVANGASYTVGSAPSAGCSTSDALSGVKTNAALQPLTGPGTTNPNGVGSFTATCSGAEDHAGNSGSASVTYNVVYGGFVRFLQPINNTAHDLGNNPDVSTFKAGSTVPVKFQIKLTNGTIVLPTSAAWVTPQKGGSTGQPVDETVYTDPATSGSTYVLNGDHHQYNWKTDKSGAGFYWLIGVKLDDGQTYRVYISLR